MAEWKIPLFKIYSDQDDIDAVSKIIERGLYWAEGPEIAEFEKKIAEFVGTKYALTFNSGTSALHTILLAYGIEGKEVIVPSFTFIATVNSVVLSKALPIFAETETETLGLDSEDVKKKITEKTKAIIALHYGGIPSRDIEKLRKIANENNLLLIEDAAEAMGASINGKKVGTFGDASMFSFCQNKILPTGEGGAIVTNSKDIYEKAKLIRSHGRVEELEDYFSNIGDNDYINVGYNYRMPTVLAALGLSQLKKIQKLIDARRDKARYLNQHLSQIEGIKVHDEITGHFSVYQLYVIQLEDEKTRDSLQQFLKDKSIMSKVYFNPVHLKTIYKQKYNSKKEYLPQTETLSKKILNLPIYPHMSKDEMDYIIESVQEFFKNRKTYEFQTKEINMNFQNLNASSENPFKNKIILVTGGCGSIGSEIVRQLLKHNPKSIRIFDNRETESFYMEHEFLKYGNVKFLLGDIRDKERLILAVKGADIIFHAAALKHIPLCEFNPFEAVKTNVIGTNNVIEAALSQNVEKVINISTDKVTNAINTLGSTKLLAERLIASAQYWKGDKRTIFSSVRFGNVVGSNGSVTALFKKQISKGGPITITDPKMTRFIMSTKQAVKLVLDTVNEMRGGETFILKMPVFVLHDLVEIILEHLAPRYGYVEENIKKEVIGIRPGEKMYEELMTEEESNKIIETKDKFIILPQTKITNWTETDIYEGRIKTIQKRYSSRDITPLTKEELRKLMQKEELLD